MIGLAVTSIITVCVTFLKGAASVLCFLFKTISRLLRLAACLVPLTVIGLLAAAALIVYMAFSGSDPLPEAFFFHINSMPFMTSLGSLMLMIRDLRSDYPGAISVIVLIAAVILFLPVTAVLLIAHSLIAMTPVILYLLIADIALYIIYGVISGRTPFAQISDRYYALFPKRARIRDEKNYRAWLRRHSEEFKNDTFGRDRADERAERRRRRLDEYYGEDEFDDELYDEYSEDNEEYDRLDDDHDDYDDYDDYRDRRRGHRSAPADTRNQPFDFFAGCDDLSSVERKYRSLAKIYHPDNQNGDTRAIQEINAQYAEAKRMFRR